MNRNHSDFRLMESLKNKNARKRLLRRGLALLSVFVLLLTVDALKRMAVAWEHTPRCGYDYDHVHSADCYDENGELICGLHEHTDACYGGQDEEVPEELEVDLDDVTEDFGEDPEADAGDDAVSTDDLDVTEYRFDMAGRSQVTLSEVLAATQLPVERKAVEMVGLVDDGTLNGDPLGFAVTDQDIAITALCDFNALEIAVVTADDIQVVKLLNGTAAAQVEAPATETSQNNEQPKAENPADTNDSAAEDVEQTEVGEQDEVDLSTEDMKADDEADTAVDAPEANEQAENDGEAAEQTEANEQAENDGEAAEQTEASEQTENDGETTEQTEASEQAENDGEAVEQTEANEQAENDGEAAEQTEANKQAENDGEAVEQTEANEQTENDGEAAEQTEASEQAENDGEAAEQNEASEQAENDGEAAEQTEVGEQIENNDETETDDAAKAVMPAEIEDGNNNEDIENTETGDEAKSEGETDETKSEDETDEIKSEGETDETKSEGETDETKSEGETDEAKSEGETDEAKSEGETDETADDETDETADDEADETADDENDGDEAADDETADDETDETDETEQPDIEALYPAQTFTGHAANIRVDVTAEVGAFPADTQMVVTPVWDQEQLDSIADTVSEDFVEVKRVLAVDIAFFNVDGEEIEPLQPISVVMTVDELEENQDAVVVHVDDDGNPEVVEQSDVSQTGDSELALNVELPAAENAEELLQTALEKQTPADETGDEPTDETADQPTDETGDQPTDKTADQPTDETGDEPTDETGDQPTDETGDETADETADQPTDGTADQPTDETADETTDAPATVEYGTEQADETVEEDGEALDIIEEEVQTEAIAFEAESFSVYAIVVTETIETKYIAADGTGYIITVGYGQDAEIPAGATLAVREIGVNDDAYMQYVNESALAIDNNGGGMVTFARLFDIEIQYEGQKVEPKASVTVDISLDNAPEETEETALKVVHFDEADGPVVMDTQADESSDLHFDTASFSVYAVLAFRDVTSANDLGGRTATIDFNGAYMTTTSVGGSPNQLLSTSNPSDAALFRFEKTEGNGNYYIYTIVNGEKQYLRLDRLSDSWSHGHIGDAQVFTVEQVNDKYVLSTEISGRQHYLRQRSVNGNSGFSGSEWNVNESKLTLTFKDSQVSYGKHYALVAKKVGSDEAYSVQNDGSLNRVTYDATTNRVTLGTPKLWDYVTENGRTFLRHDDDGYNFGDNQLANDHIHAYIDPTNPEAVSYDKITSYYQKVVDNKLINEAASFDWVNQDNVNLTIDNHHIRNGNSFIAIQEGADGSVKLVGDYHNYNGDQLAAINAWEFYLAEVQEVPTGYGWTTNTVSHIDIGIKGEARATIPIPYGRYVDANGAPVTVNTNIRVELVKSKEELRIEADDLRNADITAYKMVDGKVTPQDSMFYITGYSANKETTQSEDQVRIEGVFKVADGESLDNLMPNGSIDVGKYNSNAAGWYNNEWIGYRDAIFKARKDPANRVYYSVIVNKPVEFELKDANGNTLYKIGDDGQPVLDEHGNKVPATVTINMRLSASFDYWDPDNECPPIKEPRYYDSGWRHDNNTNATWYEPQSVWNRGEWENGAIWRDNGSGMDFRIGGNEEVERETYALQITKTIEDENGRVIQLAPNTSIENGYDILMNATANPHSVACLNVEGYERDADYTGYEVIDDTLSTTIGASGMGFLFKYRLDGGMYAIREHTDEASLPRMITDAEGKIWVYEQTYIETEYAKRQDKYGDAEGLTHVSKVYTDYDNEDYRAVPEVLGPYDDLNGKQECKDYLKFYVHNVYVPAKTDLLVKKNWANNASAPAGASVDVVLKRYRLVPDGSITPDEPEDATLTISDSYTGLGGDRTYSATYYVTGPNGYSNELHYGSNMSIEGLAFGEYTIHKVASAQADYDYNNYDQTIKVNLGGAGKTASFSATQYMRHQSAGTHHRIVVTAAQSIGGYSIAGNLTPNTGTFTWIDDEYPEGTVLSFTFGVPSWQGPNNRSYYCTINGAQQAVMSAGNTYTTTLTMDKDYNIVVFGEDPYYGGYLDPIPTIAVTSQPASTPKRSMAGMRSMRAAAGLEGTSSDGKIVLTNGKNPPEIAGYSWQLDTTWCEGDGLVVHLPDNGAWQKTVEDLEEYDTFGNTYVYFIDSVTERGMPAGTTASIDLSGDAMMLVYGDHKNENAEHTNDTLSLTNTLPTTTDISVKKVDSETQAPLNAVFTLKKYTDSGYTTQPSGWTDQTVTVNGTATVTNLGEGYYKLVETDWPTGYVRANVEVCFRVYIDSSSKEVVVENLSGSSLVTYALENKEFTVDNTPLGALSITKVVKVDNGTPLGDYLTAADGDYMFSITPVGSDTALKWVQITVFEGKAKYYRMADTQAAALTAGQVTAGTVLVTGLVPGDYVIKETDRGGMDLTSITDGADNDGNTTNGTITLTVKAGDTTAAQATSQATFTNSTYTVRIFIEKVDCEDTSKKLDGATFKLLKWNDTSKKYDLVAEKTTENGQINFGAMTSGEYQIVETVMPSGYIKVDNNDIYFTLDKLGNLTRHVKPTFTYDDQGNINGVTKWNNDGDDIIAEGGSLNNSVGKVIYELENRNATFTVGNLPGARLPSTGGPGTTLFTIGGILIVALAAALLVWKRKRGD